MKGRRDTREGKVGWKKCRGKERKVDRGDGRKGSMTEMREGKEAWQRWRKGRKLRMIETRQVRDYGGELQPTVQGRCDRGTVEKEETKKWRRTSENWQFKKKKSVRERWGKWGENEASGKEKKFSGSGMIIMMPLTELHLQSLYVTG